MPRHSPNSLTIRDLLRRCDFGRLNPELADQIARQTELATSQPCDAFVLEDLGVTKGQRRE